MSSCTRCGITFRLGARHAIPRASAVGHGSAGGRSHTRVSRPQSGGGYRGIAVGFPGGVNYAFNAAERVPAHCGRAICERVLGRPRRGNFNPKGRAIELAQDVAFYRLAEDDAPWPLRPVMTKDRSIPDPMYPRNRGYQFGGYQLDKDGVPTFLYRTGAVTIEDTRSRRGVQSPDRPRPHAAAECAEGGDGLFSRAHRQGAKQCPAVRHGQPQGPRAGTGALSGGKARSGNCY